MPSSPMAGSQEPPGGSASGTSLEATDGGPIAFVADGDRIASTCRASRSTSSSTRRARLADKAGRRTRRATTGVLGKYAKLVNGAETGAITN